MNVLNKMFYELPSNVVKTQRSCVDSKRSEINTMYWNPYFSSTFIYLSCILFLN